MSLRSVRSPALTWAAGCLSILITLGCSNDGNGFDLGDSGGMAAIFVADETNPTSLTVSLSAGAMSGTAFDIDVLVTGIDRFFGTAFRITFDPVILRYEGFRTDDSFILESGVATDFRAKLDSNDPGTLVVNATRQGPVAGVDAADSQLLMTFSFIVEQAGELSRIEFGNETTRQVTTCPEPPEACSIVSDTELSWPGGSAAAN